MLLPSLNPTHLSNRPLPHPENHCPSSSNSSLSSLKRTSHESLLTAFQSTHSIFPKIISMLPELACYIQNHVTPLLKKKKSTLVWDRFLKGSPSCAFSQVTAGRVLKGWSRRPVHDVCSYGLHLRDGHYFPPLFRVPGAICETVSSFLQMQFPLLQTWPLVSAATHLPVGSQSPRTSRSRLKEAMLTSARSLEDPHLFSSHLSQKLMWLFKTPAETSHVLAFCLE